MKIYGKGISYRPAIDGKQDTPHNKEIYLEQLLPLEDYDMIIVLFSGGKDSLACVLRLLEMGVPKEKIELWHHDIDGGEPNLHMDWLPTQNYCRAVAEYLGIRLRVSWRIGGFWSEVYRIGASNPILYENGGEIAMCKLSERQKRTLELKSKVMGEDESAKVENYGKRGNFPAKSANLAQRWCSSYLKIMVGGGAIRSLETDELKGIGECNKFPAKAKRLVHTWRTVIDWSEAYIWEIIKRWHISPHPCYFAGWNRCSCAMCIFGLPKHWAGIRELFPDWYEQFRQAEIELNFTLDNKKNLDEYIGDAESCVCRDNPRAIQQLLSGEFSVDDVYAEDWQYPAGAFKGADGGPC